MRDTVVQTAPLKKSKTIKLYEERQTVVQPVLFKKTPDNFQERETVVQSHFKNKAQGKII
jgi:hypothetical protein